MKTSEIIIGIIEVFSAAAVEKTNWSKKAAVALLRDILLSYPLENPDVFLNRFIQLLADKTSWGSRQLVHQLQMAWIVSLATSLQAAEEHVCDAQSHINTLEAQLQKVISAIEALPSDGATEGANSKTFPTTAAMVVEARSDGYKPSGKLTACPSCKRNNQLVTMVKGNETIKACACGYRKVSIA